MNNNKAQLSPNGTPTSNIPMLNKVMIKQCTTLAALKQLPQPLELLYSLGSNIFGNFLVASTTYGICYMAFYDEETLALQALTDKFPNTHILHKKEDWHEIAFHFPNWQNQIPLPLHLIGSDFQLDVWRQLLIISLGSLSTYGAIAQMLDKPKASRAVGTAIGLNPIAYWIPCHRVVQASGGLSGYMWGVDRKAALINWEAAIVSNKSKK